jgi:hypothetical protein
MDNKLQIVAVLGALALLLVVLEMVRRRRLMERYALLWMLSATVILALAVWQDALNVLAEALGVASPPNALFFIAVAFILLLLLHFSAAMSRLTDQSKVLAQRQAILEERLRSIEAERAKGPLGPVRTRAVAEDERRTLARSSAR